MAAIMSLTSYRLDLEWLLTWFPIQGNSALENQKMRAGTLHHLNTEEPFASGGAISYMLGQGQDGDPLSPNNVAIPFITISVNEDHAFSLALEAHLGKAVRHGSLLAPPNVRLPFMLNIVHPGGTLKRRARRCRCMERLRQRNGPSISLRARFNPAKSQQLYPRGEDFENVSNAC